MPRTSRSLRRRVAISGALLIAFAVLAGSYAAPAPASVFDPELIISNENMRASTSMSSRQIQAFLETQPGPLKSLATTDHAGIRRPASEIIWLASREWSISPKVLLTLLQKEQSLLTRTTWTARTLSRAIGAGCPDADTNRYPGFGRQMWFGARLLDGYGEGKNGSTIRLYYPGIAVKDIYRDPMVTLHPRNLATYKLYIYNPSIGADPPYGDLSDQLSSLSGNASFWVIYRRYFGSTFALPRMRPVYAFRKKSNGSFLYTTSIAERVALLTGPRAPYWTYRGTSMAVDASATAPTVPLYRFYNRSTHKYSFTTSTTLYRQRRSATGRRTWTYQGVAFRVSRERVSGGQAIFRFRNRVSGARWLTGSRTMLELYYSDVAVRRRWVYEGVVYYLPRLQLSP